MVCAAAPSGSGHRTEAEALVYNFVKRKKPSLLVEMFGKQRCRELEKQDHLYNENSLLSMMKAVSKRLPTIEGAGSSKKQKKIGKTEQKDNSADIKVKKKDKESATICKSSHDYGAATTGSVKEKITPELAVFNYFYERQQEQALTLLFDEKKREALGKKVETMGIWMPTVRRMYAHYRYLQMKDQNRLTLEIWNCELCKKDLKSSGRALELMRHIGIHEDIPCPCIVEGCDATLRRPDTLGIHLKDKHVLPVTSMNSEQYYALKEVEKQFRKRAEPFLSKYFPPEAFICFNDRKNRGVARDLEDPKCRKCGQIRKHSTKVGDLNEAQLFQYKKIKLNFGEIMRKEVPNYFPYKNELPEEEFVC
uniref:C2H2-type domain-containing protein n=1 Tax=Steinernema glaseri TaxID=37863 RepID=A0A1I7ZHG6_9BILA